MQTKSALPNSERPGTIAFRIDRKHLTLLEELARKAGINPGILARLYVIEALDRSEQISALQEASITLGAQIEQLGTEIALSI